MLLGYLVTAVGEYTAAEVINQVLQAGPVSPATRQAIETELTRHDTMEGYAWALRTERALSLDTAREIPAATFWMTDAKASGDYTVAATFNEPKYMNLNTHPHPYGVFIGGNDMGTADQTDLYCAAYGNGRFVVRGFGPAPFKMNGFLGEANDAVHKAAGKGQPVMQDVALSVKGSTVECSINGTVVARYDKATLVTGGKLKSTDGTYGLRFAHNTDVMVTGLTMTKD